MMSLKYKNDVTMSYVVATTNTELTTTFEPLFNGPGDGMLK